MSSYSTTPLVKKLGIKRESTLALLSAPRDFRGQLDLPNDVRVRTHLEEAADLAIWFVVARGDLATKIAGVARAMGQGLWIAWPKKSSGVKTDLTENVIRELALPHGIVDYKVCAIDETWSGLKFARRKLAK
jgi:hypothetical protein